MRVNGTAPRGLGTWSAGLAAIALALAGAIASPPAAAQTKVRFAVEIAADVEPGKANQAFIKRVADKTGGRIRIDYFPNGSLYRGGDVLQALLRGDLEIGMLYSAFWTGVAPKAAILELPYAFPTHESFYRASSDREFMGSLYGDAEAKGVKVLGYLPYDYLMPGAKRPLVNPADFNGLKMRGVGRTNTASLAALGATAVPVNVTEVSTALQQGVIDGLNSLADAFVSYRWYESIKHLTSARYLFGYYPWAVNAKWWASLPPADQKALQDAMDETIAEYRPRMRTAMDEAVAELRRKGIAVHVQTPQEAQAWRAAMAPKLWEDAERQHGKPLLDKLRSFEQ